MSLHLEAPNKRGTQWLKYAKDALRVGFDRAIKLEFHGAKVSSDADLFPYRDLDEAAQRVIIATLRAWIGFRLNPNGKYRLIL